jgi:ketosteroid isomerase-like protein
VPPSRLICRRRRSPEREVGAVDAAVGGAILAVLMKAAVELVRQIIEALNRGDVDGMLARMHPGFEWRPLETSPVARVYRGCEQVRRYVEDWLATFDVVRLDLEDTTEVADRVVTVVRGHGRGRASGLELGTRFCQVWTVRCGRAVGMEEYATREEGLAALRSRWDSHGRDATAAAHSEDQAPGGNQPPWPW